MSKKRFSIVFEESIIEDSDGHRFNVFVEGITPERSIEIENMSREEQILGLSTGEYWTLRSFQLVVNMMRQMGVIKTVSKK